MHIYKSNLYLMHIYKRNLTPTKAFGFFNGISNGAFSGHHSGSLQSTFFGKFICPKEHCTMNGIKFSSCGSVIFSRDVGYPFANKSGKLDIMLC